MIASENFVPQAVLDCQGSVLTNKYAEGYPGRRYYGGCEYVDIAEQLAIDRAKALFGADHVNVQPHSGAQANSAAYMALLDPGDRILGMKLDHGGHLTHGMKINFSGLYFDIVAYGVREEDSRLDMDELAQIAEDSKPKLIIAGWSAYSAAARLPALPRDRRLRGRDPDGGHGALRGARGGRGAPEPGAVLRRGHDHHAQDARRRARRDDHVPRGVREEDRLARVPGPPGRAADAQRSRARRSPSRSRRRTSSASASAAPARARRSSPRRWSAPGVNVLTGGTDVHLVLADLRDSELDGKQAEDRLHDVGITVNRNAVPFDPRPPAVSSGLRIGTPALATRGFQADDFREIGRVIGDALTGDFSDAKRSELSERTRALADRHPLYPQLAEAAVA